ncbi:DUF3274 domain-containing protein [Paraburkholderia xenovorans]|uniref:effector protein Tle3 domain-containing protein n=1 Tax=Paraburkholderia xenovorans TaxID=36873 RepID=UPI0038BB077E
MNELKKVRFQQRLWTKKPDPWDGKPRLVGALPAYLTVIDDERRFINGEPITPPYAPNLYGGEAIKGSPKKAGKDRPDDVSRDLVLGNPDAGLQWKPFPPDMPANLRGNTAGMMAWYNARSADPEDHTNAVRVADGRGLIYYREETPNEARQRMGIDKKSWDENSYHSAILRDSDNLRRVAAMDVAIGQAKALDDKDWRALLIAIADWKTDAEGLKKIQNNPKFQSLSKKAQALVEANARYYSAGAFPTASISKRPPSLVDAETYRDREKRQ